MDLTNLDMAKHADRGAVLNVRHPVTRNVIDGMKITLRGNDSTAYHNRLLQLRRKIVQSKDIDIEATNREYEEARVELVISWQGVEWEGEAIECTPDNVRRIFSVPGLKWLVDQVDAFVVNRANFFVDAGTT